jgi:hypothetical protein
MLLRGLLQSKFAFESVGEMERVLIMEQVQGKPAKAPCCADSTSWFRYALIDIECNRGGGIGEVMIMGTRRTRAED